MCVFIVLLYFVLFAFSGFTYVACFPSVLCYCWLGLLTCNNGLPYNLYCVGGDVKHWSINQSINLSVYCFRLLVLLYNCKELPTLLSAYSLAVVTVTLQVPAMNSSPFRQTCRQAQHTSARRRKMIRHLASYLTPIVRC